MIIHSYLSLFRVEMKKLFIILPMLSIVIISYLIAQSNNSIPKGWFVAENSPSEYKVGIDNSVFENGYTSAFIRPEVTKGNGF